MSELSNVNLTALRAVDAVARLGTLRAAADELGVTPGAVSQQVIKVEAQLGRLLFKRNPGGMVTTELGREVSLHLADGFAALARGVSHARKRPENSITVSVAPVFAGKWLVWRLGWLAELYPDLRVWIEASVDLVDPIDGEVDVCIRVGQGNWPGVRAQEILQQHVFPVCAPNLADQLKDVSDLSRVPIIREPQPSFGWDVWLRPNGMSEDQLGDGPVYSDASLCIDAAVAGQGVFLAWETLAQDALAMDQITAPFPGRFSNGVSYWFVEPSSKRLRPHVEAFREWLFDELRGSGSQPGLHVACM